MIDNVVYERSVSKCDRLFTTKIYKKILIPYFTPLGSPHLHSKMLGMPLLCPCTQDEKVRASASVCCVTLCVYCWVHFVTIGKMYGNLFSCRPSKVLPCS